MSSSKGPAATLRALSVWELPLRLFHWAIVVLVAAAYLTWRLNWMDWHVWIGLAALTALLFRILWGFWGGESARFAHFAAGPRAALEHLRHLARREPDYQVGHNPAGAWMVWLLLVALLVQTLSGLIVNNDIADAGPLTERMPAALSNAITAAHRIGWDVLAAAVAVHITAILWYALAKGQNLITPMLSGRKQLPYELAAPREGGTLRALALLAISALCVAALARFA
jgi:cytochrome b